MTRSFDDPVYANGDRVHPVADKLDSIGVPYVFATGDVRVAGDSTGNRLRLEKPYTEKEVVNCLASLLADT